jgi:type IV secretory pathway VirB10-like protein
MNRGYAVALIGMTLVGCAFAETDKFSQIVKPDDFTSAGLSKLTPEELARLDRLIADYKSGALEAAQKTAADAATAQAAAEARASQAEAETKAAVAATERARQEAQAEKAKRTADAAAAAEAARKAAASASTENKVIISPGTRVEYRAFESHIVGKVDGWDAHTVFTLENGTRWEVADYTHYFNGGSIANPKVTVAPTKVFGGFRLTIEGMGDMRVRLLSSPDLPTK